MARRIGRVLAMAAALVCSGMTLAAAGGEGGHEADPVRPVGSQAEQMFGRAVSRSATLRGLVASLAPHNVRVHLLISAEPGSWRGHTRLVSGTGPICFLSITINAALNERERAAVLAHELQHAREATEAGVASQVDMTRLFERIGFRVSVSETYETEAARVVEKRVREEWGR